MKRELKESFEIRVAGTEDWYSMTVPGSAMDTLVKAGVLPDPYYGENEYQVREFFRNDFDIRGHFTVSPEEFKAGHMLLVFNGIDTVADLYLNGHKLGHTENMHRRFTFDIKKYAKEGDNLLEIHLASPLNFIESYKPAKGREIHMCNTGTMPGNQYIRKPHCMFGWDWGPQLPDAGIFREIELVTYEKARLMDTLIRQKHEEGQVTLTMTTDVEKDADAKVKLTYEVMDPDGKLLYLGEDSSVKIEEPRLWWPHGSGEQPLYTVRVLMESEGEEAQEKLYRIGLRTVTVSREDDEWGQEFAITVNGKKIFARGADYIPDDCYYSRLTREVFLRDVQAAVFANFNCLRIWGGGYYPDDFFYDICDELGLIVWQDFMFACCSYDLTKEFEATITQEFIDNVKRIRHHASLGLWCGNNEMEMFIAGDTAGWCKKPSQLSDYFKMYEYIIPKVLEVYDPATFYWPASPSSGGGFDAPNDENRGDVHYWDVWHGNKPITEFRKFYFRYLSEFGFQSFPSLKTVETFTEPGDRNIFSYVMEKHQRNQSANGKIMNYLGQTFLYPNDFDTLLYASQLLQAEAMRYGVEHFRRNRGRCMGTVIWQLNDCWPVASWAMIDYEGRWKAVQYYAKRFFAPLMISCQEEGTLSQNTNVNAEPFELKKSATFCVANETMEEKEVQVIWRLCRADGTVEKEGREELTVPALSSVWIGKNEFPEADIHEEYVSYELLEKGETVSYGSVLFCAPKHFHFRNPQLTVKTEGEYLIVTSDAYARSVEIKNEEDRLLLEDNYFDMQPGTRKIRVLSGNTEGLKIRSVYDIR